MADRYDSFAALAEGEGLGIHYRIRLVDRGASVVVIAPHGGEIEPGTSEIAMAIAQETYSFYCFEGLRAGRPHSDLHITSDRFDEPQALDLVAAAETAIAVHGRQNRSDPEAVWMGGRDHALRDRIATSLELAGFSALRGGHSLIGEGRANICNRGKSAAGVQLELPANLRDRLKHDGAEMQRFAAAVRGPLAKR